MTDEVTTKATLTEGLRAVGTDNTKQVLNNPELFGFMLNMFNDTVKMASGKTTDVAIGFAKKTLSTSKIAGKAANSESLVIGATAAQLILSSASLISLAGKSNPTVIFATVGATFAKKTALAFGMVKDDKAAKCLGAIADLAAAGLGSTAAGAAALAAASTGIGLGLAAVILAGSFAQLALSGYQAHQACIAANPQP